MKAYLAQTESEGEKESNLFCFVLALWPLVMSMNIAGMKKRVVEKFLQARRTEK